jgi:hypothetical protein
MSRALQAPRQLSSASYPARKPPYTHKTKKGSASLVFDEGPTCVMPLGSIQTEEDIEQLARRVAALVTGE